MPPPTTNQHHPQPPTTSQNTSTTTHYHPKNGPPLVKAKIYYYKTPLDILLTVSFSTKCNIPFRGGDFVWYSFDQFVFQVPNVYYILRYLRFLSLYFKSLRLQDLLLFVFINRITILTTRRVSNQKVIIIIGSCVVSLVHLHILQQWISSWNNVNSS